MNEPFDRQEACPCSETAIIVRELPQAEPAMLNVQLICPRCLCVFGMSRYVPRDGELFEQARDLAVQALAQARSSGIPHIEAMAQDDRIEKYIGLLRQQAENYEREETNELPEFGSLN